MYKTPLLAALSLSLAACTTTTDQQAKIDQAATIACISMEAADGFFNQIAKAPGTKITADQLAIEAQVYAGVKGLCTPPYTTDLPNLVKKATDAAAAIYALTKA